ncbi:dicarboxylate/amino acid:cation symporter [Thalassolituus sp. C2-1]|uniref:dicarboxylate/amino acid:cation symporter n=1 Tax=Venatorbacter sp. C2-1 TaxID=2597518 RepID=UPI0011932705|nr:dicarboxylate/amino acid:cation symporter [Thalassolituus sp. C2-1]TVV44741.1 dicarboxylate/amino acid:cation symporter [Thalassolituus sp. C2-1]
MSLTRQILIAMTAAILLGSLTQRLLLIPDLLSDPVWQGYLHYFLDDFLTHGLFLLGGKIFIASLKVLVVPLVFVSLVCGVCHLRDQGSLGRLSLKTIVLYLATTGLAISLALLLAGWWQPGAGVDKSTGGDYVPPQPMALIDVLANIFPSNPVQAMAEGTMLQVIVFALLIGVAIGRAGEYGERIGSHFNDWNEVLMKLVTLLMSFAPYGVFCLLFTLFAEQGIGKVGDLALYMLTVTSVLLLHGFVVYPLLLKGLSGLSPRVFLRKMRNVQLFAFSTASSTATVPVTLRAVEQRLGVQNRVAAFSVPLGATINMDGTAIMQGVATAFIAQAYGFDLTLSQYLLVVLTAMLASIGTAGVPGVGLVTLALVLEQVQLPVEGIALIIGVDRILDMMRTAVNVTGDAMVSVVVARSEGALDHDTYNNPKAGEQN